MTITRINVPYELTQKVAYDYNWTAIQTDYNGVMYRLQVNGNSGTALLYKSTDGGSTWSDYRIMLYYPGSPIDTTGKTAKQIFDAAQKQVIYQWSHSASSSYSPTGENGYWTYRLFDSYEPSKNWGTFEALKLDTGERYLFDYRNNVWREGEFNSDIVINSNNLDRDAANPSSTQWSHGLLFNDKNNERITAVGSARYTDGRIGAYLYSYNEKTDGTQVNNNILVYVNRAGTQTYSVANAANFRSAIGAAASSDRRLKSDIEPLEEDAVEFISKLKPVVYTINGERQVGLIAQDVHEADSWGTRMAFETQEDIDGLDDWEKMDDGSPTWKLDYIRIIAPLTAALQKLTERVDQLEAEIAELKA